MGSIAVQQNAAFLSENLLIRQIQPDRGSAARTGSFCVQNWQHNIG